MTRLAFLNEHANEACAQIGMGQESYFAHMPWDLCARTKTIKNILAKGI